MDENNFRLNVDGHDIHMVAGELVVDGATYEDDPEQEHYAVARELFRQKQRIAELEKKVKELEDTIEDYNNDAYERSELDV